MFSPKLLLISAGAVALVGSTMAFSSLCVSTPNTEEKIVSGQGGLKFYQTTGDVLNPKGSDGTANAGIDPMEYLRNFNYGRVLTLEDGTI